MTCKRFANAALIASATACFSLLANFYLVNSGIREQPPSSVFVEVPEGQNMPRLRVTSERAFNGEWFLHIDTRNFIFTDLCVTRTGRTWVGHAHVHEGDRKVGTAYAPVFSLGHLAPGRHEFLVMLRAQDGNPPQKPMG